MRTIGRFLFMAAVLTGCSTMTPGTASQDAASGVTPAPMLVRVELNDGSQVIGTELRDMLPLVNASGKIRIPVKTMRSITMSCDTGTVTVVLAGGDRMSGVLDIKEFRLATVFGKVSIPLSQVKGVRVQRGGIDAGLLVHYTFDNCSGATVFDESGNGRDGTLHSAEIVSNGRIKSACRVGPQAGYVSAPSDPQWSFGMEPFTIALWVNLQEPPQGEQAFIGCDDGGGERNKWIFEVLHGSIDFHINTTASESSRIASHPWTSGTGAWHHIAVTRKGSQYQIFLDGDCVKTDTNGSMVPDIRAPLTIGHAERLYINGMVDDVRIYGRTLSNVEVATLARMRSE